jgi:hypothetical protein
LSGVASRRASRSPRQSSANLAVSRAANAGPPTETNTEDFKAQLRFTQKAVQRRCLWCSSGCTPALAPQKSEIRRL